MSAIVFSGLPGQKQRDATQCAVLAATGEVPKQPNDSEEQLNVLQDSTSLRALSRTGFVTGLPSAKLNSTIIASLISIRQLRGQGVSNRCRRSEERRVGKECRSRW